MLKQGYLDECLQILEQKWDRTAKPLQSFSYKYLLKHLDGELKLEEAIERTEIGTWHLARKQRTWARNIGWQPISPEEARQQAFDWVSNAL
jgi:tRNA A37 N6-isopentenylltransferase MiaA